MFETLMNELITQAPYLAAVIIIVVYFIRAMNDQRTVFNTMMNERDRLFDESLKRRDELFQKTMQGITASINSMENSIIVLDSDARHAMEIRKKRLPKRKNPGS